MKEGLLWFDADPKRDLAKKVAQAANRYQEKFGTQPNTCYVNPDTIDISIQVNGIRLIPIKNVLKHHFWIGVENEAKEVV